jgi:hypothetical protein
MTKDVENLHTLQLTEQQFVGVSNGSAPTIFVDRERLDILPKQHVLMYECTETAGGKYRKTGRVMAGLVTSVLEGYPMCAEYRAVTVKKIAQMVELLR